MTSSSPTPEPSSAPTKYCYTCALPFPIESFPYRDRERGTRSSRCLGCNATYMREYRARQRAKRLGKTFAELRAAPDNDRVRALVQVAFRQFGGLNGFVTEWKRQYVSAKPGSRVASNMLDAMMRLSEAVEASRPAKVDRSLLSDEDLERSIDERLVRHYPDGRRNDG